MQKRSSGSCKKSWMSCHLCISKLNRANKVSFWNNVLLFWMFQSNVCIYSFLCWSKILNFRKSLSQKKLILWNLLKFCICTEMGIIFIQRQTKMFFKHDQYNNPETKYLHLIILIWKCYWVFDLWTKNRLRFYIKQLLFLWFYVYLYGKVKQSLFLYALTL